MSDQDFFNKSLQRFAKDFASGGAVRQLWDRGYSIEMIKNRLDFPLSLENIREIVWNHLLEQGIIRLTKPIDDEAFQKVTYVEDYDQYGRPSLRRVVYKSLDSVRYVEIDFGTKLYQDKEAFLKKLDGLDQKDRQYVLDIPWPLGKVYHKENEQMKRIYHKIYQVT